MTVPRWHKKLAAAGLVLGLVAIVAVALTMFSGGFTKSTPITVTSTRAGLVMEPNAKVKLRGVQVGRVESISLVGDAQSIRVHDTGPGIPPEDHARIFEPFEQMEPLPNKHTRGVGLGLSIVKEMVEALSGTIDLDSALGRGSTFTVTFPPQSATQTPTTPG